MHMEMTAAKKGMELEKTLEESKGPGIYSGSFLVLSFWSHCHLSLSQRRASSHGNRWWTRRPASSPFELRLPILDQWRIFALNSICNMKALHSLPALLLRLSPVR